MTTETLNACTDLIPSVALDEFLAQRARVLELWNASIDSAAQAASASGKMFGCMHSEISDAYTGRRVSADHHPDEAKRLARFAVDAAGWRYLMRESGMLANLDSATRRNWESALEWAHGSREHAVPELTREVIAATFGQLLEDRGGMFRRSVVDLFRTLSWNYRANKPVKFGDRLVLRYAFSENYWGGTGRFDAQVSDLDSMMHRLDGRPIPDNRANLCTLDIPTGEKIAADYFELRGFKNRNVHVRFLRTDLRDRLNEILAEEIPDALPAPDERSRRSR